MLSLPEPGLSYLMVCAPSRVGSQATGNPHSRAGLWQRAELVPGVTPQLSCEQTALSPALPVTSADWEHWCHVSLVPVGAVGWEQLLTLTCARRGGHPGGVQDADGDLRDPSEPDRPHLGQLPDMAALRGGEALHRLLQHQQRQVPALPDTPQECQGEQGLQGPSWLPFSLETLLIPVPV